jgi:hypothetical protein
MLPVAAAPKKPQPLGHMPVGNELSLSGCLRFREVADASCAIACSLLLLEHGRA